MFENIERAIKSFINKTFKVKEVESEDDRVKRIVKDCLDEMIEVYSEDEETMQGGSSVTKQVEYEVDDIEETKEETMSRIMEDAFPNHNPMYSHNDISNINNITFNIADIVSSQLQASHDLGSAVIIANFLDMCEEGMSIQEIRQALIGHTFETDGLEDLVNLVLEDFDSIE